MLLAAECQSDFWTAVQHLSLGGGIVLSVVALCVAAVLCVFFWGF